MARTPSTKATEQTVEVVHEEIRAAGEPTDLPPPTAPEGYKLGEVKVVEVDPEPKTRPYGQAITKEHRDFLGPNAPTE